MDRFPVSAWRQAGIGLLLCIALLAVISRSVAGPVEALQEIRGSGVIRTVDHAHNRLTIMHEPIRRLGLPAMATSFEVRKDLPLGGLRPGQQMLFTLDTAGRIVTLTPVLEADAIPLFPEP